MTFNQVLEVPQGDYHRSSLCMALVGPPEVSIRWAVDAMEIQSPINARRTLLCYPHPNLDTARNIAIAEWKKANKDLQTEWIALLASDSRIRPDAITMQVLQGQTRARIGETYLFHRDEIKDKGPWFENNTWTGGTVHEAPSELGVGMHEGETYNEMNVPSEEAKKMIVVAVPSLGKTSLMWAAHAINLISPIASSRALILSLGREVGDARNRLVEAALNMNPQPAYLLFFGDDMIPSPNSLLLLFETMEKTNAEAVSGLYFMKSSPPSTPLLWRNTQPGVLFPGRDFEIDDVVPCDGAGLDFCLFRLDALAKMPALRFRTVMDWIEGRGLILQTEDAFFWDRFRETFGHGPLVDTRCRVGHYSNVDGGIY